MLFYPVSDHPNRFSNSARFGAPRSKGRRLHKGNDTRPLPAGTELGSPKRGRLEDVYWSNGGGGWIAVIDHGLIESFARPGQPGHTITKHMHIHSDENRSGSPPSMLVDVGTVLDSGEPFAIAGETGNARGIHDHWEVHIDGEVVDPLQCVQDYATVISGVFYGWVQRYPGQLLPGPVSRMVQTFLEWHGISVGVDGIFGDRTEAGVMELQRRRGLTVDGIVGPNTWDALVPAYLR
ncbi:MAG: peptidoglycan-binding protein [Nitriliruptorales bacterium]|nr:peptidoglycan-binding protein [Nitriliruptorales bacterium]